MISSAETKLYGLVLAGGRSLRMGSDKGSIQWHGKKQRDVIADLLKDCCEKVYLSCRMEQVNEIVSEGHEVIPDAFEDLGPYGALLSAFGFNSNVAWLVVACDLPLINSGTFMQLTNERDSSKVATTFRSPFDHLPEPLITIWEPRSYQVLKARHEEGKTCPRKALLNSNIKIIEPSDKDALINANTPEDAQQVLKIISANKFTQSDLSKYSCQMALPGFGPEAQRKLSEASVLIVGAGGLGCPVLNYLVSSGVGTVGLADFDIVSESNLHRQFLFTPEDTGKLKSVVAAERLRALNPSVSIISIDKRISSENVNEVLNDFEIIVDCTDNIDTKYLLNDACVLSKKPLVYGAIFRFDGQVAVWNVRNDYGIFSANYRDAFPEINQAAVPSCSEGGVLPTVAGMTGMLQANEVLKLITGIGEVLSGKMLLFDGRTSRTKIIYIQKQDRDILSLNKSVQPEQISQEELEILMEDDTVELIDVRNISEHEQFNIGGKLIQLGSVENYQINLNKRTVFYCQSGSRSLIAARMLMQKFPAAKIYSLSGGINSWKISQS